VSGSVGHMRDALGLGEEPPRMGVESLHWELLPKAMSSN
jgi:hypothetical protein